MREASSKDKSENTSNLSKAHVTRESL